MPDWLLIKNQLSCVTEEEWYNGTGFVSKADMVIFAKMQENVNPEYLSEYDHWLKAPGWSNDSPYGDMKPFFI
jgi:hypothetical protein